MPDTFAMSFSQGVTQVRLLEFCIAKSVRKGYLSLDRLRTTGENILRKIYKTTISRSRKWRTPSRTRKTLIKFIVAQPVKHAKGQASWETI
jgi:hypothetical protein